VVPQRAVVDYYIRYPDGVYLDHMSRMIDNAAKAAASMMGVDVAIDRYGEYRDGITLGTLEETMFAYAKRLGAANVDEELSRPAGYEETGGVSHDVPGVGVNVFSSRGSYHTKGMEADATSPVGHAGFRVDAQVMATILFDFLTDPPFRDAVRAEHRTMAGLLNRYQENLRRAYAPEIGQ
jgi:metal-dependent amidase/aminoacylase/carboxypeptidase family protein